MFWTYEISVNPSSTMTMKKHSLYGRHGVEEIHHFIGVLPRRIEKIETIPYFLDADRVLIGPVLQDQLL